MLIYSGHGGDARWTGMGHPLLLVPHTLLGTISLLPY